MTRAGIVTVAGKPNAGKSTMTIPRLARRVFVSFGVERDMAHDRGLSDELAERMQSAGCEATGVSATSCVLGVRQREARVALHLP
jgi:isopentenyl diphosphate isomerase/L-lactate dehydrogenase-like FMN-dependent dehydrogenase